jgi:hypothetical protein
MIYDRAALVRALQAGQTRIARIPHSARHSEPFECVPQQPKPGADDSIIIIASAVIGSPNCSHKIEFSFLNGNLMVLAGPSTIFNLTVMLVEANSTDGGVTLHQSIERDTGRLAEVLSCLSRLKLQPSSLGGSRSGFVWHRHH